MWMIKVFEDLNFLISGLLQFRLHVRECDFLEHVSLLVLVRNYSGHHPIGTPP